MNEDINKNNNLASNPSLDVDIRTMEGDIKALKESGGETSMIKGERTNVSRQGEIQSVKEASEKDIPSDAAPGANFMFPQKQETAQPGIKEFTPAPSNIENVKVEVGQKNRPVLKIILITVGVLILAVGFGILGYYLSPMIFK